MARNYYAIYHPYGTRMASKSDPLYRYPSAADRAEDEERVDWQGISDGRGHLMEIVTRAQARRDFPEAFRADDDGLGAAWWRDCHDGSGEWTGCPTGGVYEYL